MIIIDNVNLGLKMKIRIYFLKILKLFYKNMNNVDKRSMKV